MYQPNFRDMVLPSARSRRVLHRPLAACDGPPPGDIDELTGFATRRRLIASLDRRVGRPSPDGRSAALILFHLDRFKDVNDGLGPSTCDTLLQRVASRLRSVAPQADLLARMSGGCFALLLDDGREAAEVAERVLDFMGRPYAVGGHAITMGVSIGFAVAGEHGATAPSVLHAANLALHQAERDGGNRLRRFDPSMRERALVRREIETDFRAAIALQRVELHHALISEQFAVHYQPQVSLHDGHITGCEALLRWRHPERGVIGPDRFIPLAEETGLINLLGEWVLRTACRDAAAWPVPSNGTPLRVAVNVSPVQLRDGGAFLDTIQRALDETALPAERLEIEITETALVGEVGDTLAAIRRLGADLALDDFGTGYSSLSRLHHHPFTRLKIDRSFVTGLGADTDQTSQQASERMIRAIAALGTSLGLDTVVEGIETPHQQDIARLAGCTEMQGYLLSRPVPASELRDFIVRRDDTAHMIEASHAN